MRYAERGQPVPQRQQATHRRLELPHLLPALAAITRRAHARRDLRLVHIQRPGTLHHLIHHQPPASRCTERRRPEGPATTDESGKRAQGNSPAFRQGPSAILLTGLNGHQGKDAASQGDARILAHFHDGRMAARGPGYFWAYLGCTPTGSTRSPAGCWDWSSVGRWSRRRGRFVNGRLGE